MPSVVLKTYEQRTGFFVGAVRRNVNYWLIKWLPRHRDNVSMLDDYRDQMLRAVSAALWVQGIEKIKEWEHLATIHDGKGTWEAEFSWGQVCDLITELADYMEWRGNWGHWERYLNYCIKIAGHKNEPARQAGMHHVLARLQMRRDQYRDAISNYRNTIRLSRVIGDTFTEARACTNLGFFYVETGNWWRAEVLCRYALKLFEEHGSDHGLAHTHNHLGLLYTRCRQWQSAKRHLTLACEIWDNMEDKFGLVYGHANLGVLYNEMIYTDTLETSNAIVALTHLTKALGLTYDLEDELEAARIHNNICVSYWLQGNLELALKHAKIADKTFIDYKSTIGQGYVWNNFGLIYSAQGFFEDAVRFLSKALKLYESQGNTERTMKLRLDLIECCLQAKNYDQAKIYMTEVQGFISRYQDRKPYLHLIERYKKIRQSFIEALAN